MSSDDTAAILRPSGGHRTLGLADTEAVDIADVSPPTGPARLQPGAVLEHYELIRKLGAGGMGNVFLARDTRLGRLVAIKFLLEPSPEAAQRLLAEARATARCRHENIVVIHEVGEAVGQPYLVLEYIEGRTLRALMTERARGRDRMGDRAAERLAAELMIPVVRALACAHSMGLVHRDLKPENILVANSGVVLVVDFGIAKQVDAALASAFMVSGPSGSTGPNEDEGLVGTFAYMSPEQWLGDEVDGRTDLWAAGVILYELLTGAHPLLSATDGGLAGPLSGGALSLQLSHGQLMRVPHLDTPMPSAEAAAPHAAALAKIIDRCLHKQREERYPSAAELLEALELVVRQEGAPSPSPDDSPYAGLAAFQEAGAARFFGREHDVFAVLGKLRHQELLAIAGPSGAGKSSFVRAGVIPALKRASQRVEALVLRPGRRPLAALADVVASLGDPSARGKEPLEETDPESLATMLRSRPGMLGARLRARCKKLGAGSTIVLFVDQLEELYTQGIDPAERSAFYACLEGAADDASSPLRVLVTIRADFLDRVAEDRRFLAEVTRGLFFLPPMGREGLREALTRPLVAAGYHFEDDALVDEMLDGLGGASCPLPLLQFAATKLWEARDGEARQLTRSAYLALGGVAGALSAHADAVIAGLSAKEQRLAREVLVRLVTPQRTRAVLPLHDLVAIDQDAGAVEQVVAQLGAARLVMIEAAEDEREGKRVELVHESLIDRWGKLGRWLAEDAQDEQFLAQLRNGAQQWNANGEAEGLLWRDRAALEAGQWLERRQVERGAGGALGLGAREERYLRAVVALAQRTSRWRRRIAAAVFAAVCAIAVVVAALAVRAGRLATQAEGAAKQAERAAGQANEEARHARNATRMATARELQREPTTALAFLREVEGPGEPPGWSALTQQVLFAGVAERVIRHPDHTRSVELSPDGKRIAVSCRDRNIYVWNVDGSGEPLILRGHERDMGRVAWSPDGKRIVSASEDRTARVWNADGTGAALILRGHENVVSWVAWSPDGARIVTASRDRTARIWNADGTGQPRILRGHEKDMRYAAWSPDGKRIVTASEDKTARVWNADGTGAAVILRGHEDVIPRAAWSPDGEHIVTVSHDRTARIWNADGAGEARVLRGHTDQVLDVAWSLDGKRIVTASKDGTARVWNAGGTGEPVVLRGHEGTLTSATFDSSGERILTASLDSTVRLWRSDGAGDPLVFSAEGQTTASFDPTGERIASSAVDGTVRLWRPGAVKAPRRFHGHEQWVTSVAWSPNGKELISTSFDMTVRIWPVEGTAPRVVLRPGGLPIKAAFSPDGKRIVTACQIDFNAKVWSADGTGPLATLRGHEAGLYDAQWSPDGKRIATASEDRTARVWNADGTGEPVVLRGHEETVWSTEWSPDGKRIVTGSPDRTARVWNADGTGEPVVLRGHENSVSTPVWSPDGKRIATSSWDKTVRIWNADGTGEPMILRGHDNWIVDTAWSPDGKYIATASADNTVRIWNADGTGQPLVLRTNTTPYQVAWSPDSTRIASTNGSAVEVWSDLEPFYGASDPRLWTATTYCPPADRRVKLLGISEDTARADLAACARRVEEARRPAP